jgi:hypothetical protein
VIGYVIQSAQQELLGLYYEKSETAGYFTNAADFFRDSVAAPVAAASSEQVSFGTHLWPLLVATAATLALLLIPRSKPRPWLRISSLLPALLLFVLIAKFSLLDAPLTRLESIIVGSSEGPTLEGFGSGLLERSGDNSPYGQVSSPVEALWADIVCSRVTQSAANLTPGSQLDLYCGMNEAYYERRLSGAYLAHLWAGGLIIILAIAVIRSAASSTAALALAILALLYSLMIPYAYGKLKRSTYFDYGVIRLSEPLRAGSGLEPDAPLHGIMLWRSAAGANLLIIAEGACREGESYAAATMSSVSPAQILAVEKIYRVDVIAWAMLNERKCPPMPSRYRPISQSPQR